MLAAGAGTARHPENPLSGGVLLRGRGLFSRALARSEFAAWAAAAAGL